MNTHSIFPMRYRRRRQAPRVYGSGNELFEPVEMSVMSTPVVISEAEKESESPPTDEKEVVSVEQFMEDIPGIVIPTPERAVFPIWAVVLIVFAAIMLISI